MRPIFEFVILLSCLVVAYLGLTFLNHYSANIPVIIVFIWSIGMACMFSVLMGFLFEFAYVKWGWE